MDKKIKLTQRQANSIVELRLNRGPLFTPMDFIEIGLCFNIFSQLAKKGLIVRTEHNHCKFHNSTLRQAIEQNRDIFPSDTKGILVGDKTKPMPYIPEWAKVGL